ncbi:transcriptional regulator [Steroidobacter sp.]|uniref:transcriptional regulator n=1 Tax=Steroidobacter sp. TaxID=1978227 RepID=UPI001A36C669|nr:transcriptional regulator [Steroidobacter sp.]MBL8267336.1 transcriptional regulator [Steroidobacter sp.]
MLTIIESPVFTDLWPEYWTEDERGEFAAFIAKHPLDGDCIPGSRGCRKIRWARAGLGKRGGVRVIYTTQLLAGAVVLLVIYSKSARDNIPAHRLRQIAEEMGHATS